MQTSQTQTHTSKLCSKHFSKEQFAINPETYAQYGYENAKASLKEDAVPDIPIEIVSGERLPDQVQNRNAYEKRRRAEVSIEAIKCHNLSQDERW